LGAGGTTLQNYNARKINILRVFVLKRVMELVTDFTASLKSVNYSIGFFQS
jgi:hypothetical protein